MSCSIGVFVTGNQTSTLGLRPSSNDVALPRSFRRCHRWSVSRIKKVKLRRKWLDSLFPVLKRGVTKTKDGSGTEVPQRCVLAHPFDSSSVISLKSSQPQIRCRCRYVWIAAGFSSLRASHSSAREESPRFLLMVPRACCVKRRVNGGSSRTLLRPPQLDHGNTVGSSVMLARIGPGLKSR